MTRHDEHIRAHIDPVYKPLRDGLKAAYLDWRQGVPHAWKGFDKEATPAESRTEYLRLRTLLLAKYSHAFDRVADILPPENETVEADVTPAEVDEVKAARKARLVGAAQLIADAQADAIDIDIDTGAEEQAIRASLGLV